MIASTAVQRRWTAGPKAAARTPSAGQPAGVTPLSLRYQARVPVRSTRARLRDLGCRLLNVIVAIIGILVTAPVMIVVAILVKVTSPGPIFFHQPRVGIDRRRNPGPPSAAERRRADDRGGKIFTIYKFRTMRVEEGAPRQVWSSRDDPRVTPIGKFLRSTRLDEVPQFFNVLKGDMNIVGPRPEQPEIFQRLKGDVQRYGHRQRVLPGITGLAQVELGYDTDIDGVKKKVEMDLRYIRARNALTDLWIMAKTLPVLIFQKVWK